LNWTYAYGSTGKLILDIEKELPKDEFFHAYEYRVTKEAQNGVCLTGWLMARVHNRLAKLKGLPYQNGIAPTRKLIGAIREYRPDIVHIHCPNGNTLQLYKLLEYLKKNRIPVVITNHAEFFYTGNCPYAYDCTQYMTGCTHCGNAKQAVRSVLFNRTAEAWRKMKAALEGFENLRMVCVSDWQKKRLTGSVICRGIPCSTILNGVDTEVFCQKEQPSGTNGTKCVLFVTANFSDEEDDIKGGRFFIRLAKAFEGRGDIEFAVAGKGNVSDPAGLPANLKLLGDITDQSRLAGLYAAAELTVIVSRRETFGMACAESLCCGTPVVGFENGGTESIAIPEYSAFVPYADEEGLRELVDKWLDQKQKLNPKIISKAAQDKYSRERMGQEYRTLYEALLSAAQTGE
jgi:glycosyltransferase involved in cell wall biosynthesis